MSDPEGYWRLFYDYVVAMVDASLPDKKPLVRSVAVEFRRPEVVQLSRKDAVESVARNSWKIAQNGEGKQFVADLITHMRGVADGPSPGRELSDTELVDYLSTVRGEYNRIGEHHDVAVDPDDVDARVAFHADAAIRRVEAALPAPDAGRERPASDLVASLEVQQPRLRTGVDPRQARVVDAVIRDLKVRVANPVSLRGYMAGMSMRRNAASRAEEPRTAGRDLVEQFTLGEPRTAGGARATGSSVTADSQGPRHLNGRQVPGGAVRRATEPTER